MESIDRSSRAGQAAWIDAVPTALPDQLSLGKLVTLHLLPGALVTAGFIAFAPLVERAGFPPIMALLIAIAVIMLPIELGVVFWAGRAQGALMAAVPYRRPLPLRSWLWLGPLLVVAAFAGFGIHMAIEPALINGLFGWVPQWFVSPIQSDRIGDYAREAWVVTLIAYFALNSILGPITEELYFRGYLLPRIERFGRWAPLVNVSLFSLYHFWSPWQLVARILGFGATVYAVRWKQNVYLGMAVHCTLNSIAVLLVAALVIQRW